MRVALGCVFGMSTYYVVRALEKAARDRGADVSFQALPVSELCERIGEFDVVLLGPQVRFKQTQVEKIAAAAGKVVVPIPPELYSAIEAEKLLDLILNDARKGEANDAR